MKKIGYIISAFLFLVFGTKAIASAYTGFKPLKKGDWSKYTIISEDGKKTTLTYIYGGKEKVNGKTINIVEFSGRYGKNMAGIIQLWLDEKDQPVKTIMKTPDGQLICFAGGSTMGPQVQENPHTKTPEKFKPTRPKIHFGTYKTPTGKKVPVAIFKTETGETWVSSNVPFGIVKQVENGRVTMYLKDFGTGRKTKIPLDEAKSCQPFNFPGFPGMVPQNIPTIPQY
ncbi:MULTISPECIES: hypothetical protein [unclassified Desulfurobacterium]|uniref:hypothetical protein n=1 Tax=Desulfurobacterium sp. TC5-1 TaxID=1158318 RepID=UPI00040C830E|nr:hypothetical protein [Desulfurobacterium sp. TC5-1]